MLAGYSQYFPSHSPPAWMHSHAGVVHPLMHLFCKLLQVVPAAQMQVLIALSHCIPEGQHLLLEQTSPDAQVPQLTAGPPHPFVVAIVPH